MILTMVIMRFTSIVFFKNTNVRVLKVLASSIWILIIVNLYNLDVSLAFFLFTSTMIFFIGGLTEVMNIDITKLSMSQCVLILEFIYKPYTYSIKDDDSTIESEFEE